MHCTTVIVTVHDLFTSPEPESIDASNTQEETIGTSDTRHFNSEDPHRLHNFPQQISDHLPEYNFTGQQQVTSTDDNVFDEIPQLEEDWQNGQFADGDTNLINGHNTHSESEKIKKACTEHLLDLTENQYY